MSSDGAIEVVVIQGILLNKKNMLYTAAIAAVTFVLAGCATPYQSKGLTGGFTDTKIDDVTWRVRFDGNGYAKQEMVWNYWIYRCAELTLAQGYAGMAIETKKAATPPVAPYAPNAPVIPSAPSSRLESPLATPLSVAYRESEDKSAPTTSGKWSMLKTPYVRSSEDDDHFTQVASRAPTYIYIPGGGGTITTWHADGIVHMFNESNVPLRVKGWIRAAKIIELLKPYIDSSGKMLAPSRDYILSQSVVMVPDGAGS